MKKAKYYFGFVGTGLFWALWPVFVIYFRVSGPRSRVVVVFDEEVLLLQAWLGTKKWMLPGGGSKKGETLVASATRELFEETGIDAPESSLRKLGTFKHKKYHFIFKSEFYVLNLTEKLDLKLHKPEIWEAMWVPLSDAKTYQLNDETQSALRRYKPSEQASLL